MGLVVKVLGLTDILAGTILAFLDVPIIGNLKWILVVILFFKGIPSLMG
ncbi:MAG: hypothetical protein ACP5JY_00845 [Candidatus Nanoarchaeia archaeon]